MRTLALSLVALALPVAAAGIPAERLEASIQPKLGRPYVWGASGARAYDCSGFVWRALLDAGVLLKRTTARKMFYSLAPVRPADRSAAGTLVFFDQVHHVGLVRNQAEFYHSSTSHGTRLDHFDPYWRRLVSGYRSIR